MTAADPFIEQAVTSFSSVWSDTAGNMPVVCPQLSDALLAILNDITRLTATVSVQSAKIAENEQRIQILQKELGSTRHELVKANNKLDTVYSEAEGFVTQPEFKEIVSGLVEKTVVEAVETTIAAMKEDLAQKTPIADFNLAFQMTQTTREQLAVAEKEIGAQIETIRKKMSRMESDTQLMLQQQQQSLNQIDQTTKSIEADLTMKIEKLGEKTVTDLKSARSEAQGQLSSSVEEIVLHMKRHAEAIDALSMQKEEKMKRAPTMGELQQLRFQMDTIQRDLDESSFRVQEALSQCLAIAGIAGRAGGGSGGAGPISDYFTPSNPNSNLTTAVDSTLLLQNLGGNSGHKMISVGGLPPSIELQFELLKKEMQHVTNVALPSCTGQVMSLKEQVEAVVDMQVRGERFVNGLSYCLGLSPEGEDEFFSALEARDAPAVKLILKRIALAILPPWPSASSSSAPRESTVLKDLAAAAKTAALRAEAAPIASSSKPNSPLVPLPGGKKVQDSDTSQTNQGEQRLGIDLADAMTSLEHTNGVVVMYVHPGSPSDEAGFKPKDRILTVDGQNVSNCRDFVVLVKEALKKKKVSFMVERGNPKVHYVLYIQI